MALSDFLDWEENVFLGLKKSFNYLFFDPQRRLEREREFSLKSCKGELNVLGRMFSACASDIFVTEEALLVQARQICLPAALSLAASPQENRNLYLVKTLLASIVIGEQIPGPLYGTKILAHPRSRLAIPEKLLQWIEQAQDSLEDREQFWEFIGSIPATQSGGRTPSSDGFHKLDEDIERTEIATEIEGKGQPTVELVELSKGAEQEIPIHTFEKVETLEEFNGINRKHDYEDELEEHQEALQALDLSHLVRTQDRSNTLYKADVYLEPVASDVNGGHKGPGQPYPEWDYKRKQYRPDWAWVREFSVREQNHSWLSEARIRNQQSVAELSRAFRAAASKNTRKRQQLRGGEFDIDVVIDNEVSLRSNESRIDERMFVQRRRTDFTVATCLLFDTSYSIDGWLDGEHILEIIRDLVYCVGTTLDQYANVFSTACFSSNTRHECYYQLVKTFEEPWSKAAPKIGAIEPRGYTRIGPALRHSIRAFSALNAERKLILLVTDGKPCDYDRYEGMYGIRDVKQAVAEAKAEGIYVHAFTVDPSARSSFPRMFSPSGYHLVGDPKQLPSIVLTTYLRASGR